MNRTKVFDYQRKRTNTQNAELRSGVREKEVAIDPQTHEEGAESLSHRGQRNNITGRGFADLKHLQRLTSMAGDILSDSGITLFEEFSWVIKIPYMEEFLFYYPYSDMWFTPQGIRKKGIERLITYINKEETNGNR